MSMYSKLSREHINICRDWLVELSHTISTDPFRRKYFFILLYEYCACYAYLFFNNGNEFVNVSITLTPIKEYCSKSLPKETTNKLCKSLLYLRNSFAHITPELFSEKYVHDFLFNDMSMFMLSLFELPDVLINTLQSYKESLGFDPFNYIRQKVGDKVNLLPVAAVCNCKTPEDCQDLIDSLQHLL